MNKWIYIRKNSDLERSELRPWRAPARGSVSSPEGGGGYTQLLAFQGQHEKEVVPTSVSPSIRRTIENQSNFTQKNTGWACGLVQYGVTKLLQQVFIFLTLSQNEGAKPIWQVKKYLYWLWTNLTLAEMDQHLSKPFNLPTRIMCAEIISLPWDGSAQFGVTLPLW